MNKSNVIVQKCESPILIILDYLDSKKHFAIVFTKCQSVRCRRRCRMSQRRRRRIRAENIDVPNFLNYGTQQVKIYRTPFYQA